MVAPAPRAVGVARVSRVGLKVQVVARLGSGWCGIARREVVSFLAMDFRREGMDIFEYTPSCIPLHCQ